MDERKTQPETVARPEKDIVRLAAVGDLLLVADPRGKKPGRDYGAVLEPVQSTLRGNDIIFGNLECTLAGGGDTIPTEPRVVATEDMVRQIKLAGFNIVTLGNNHSFDCRVEGFRRLRGLLDELGVKHFGAGENMAQAQRPSFMEVKGVRLGFVGAVDTTTGVSDCAGADKFGIAGLDRQSLITQINGLREQCDHVIISLHWGQERFDIPSPKQVELAHALVDAGASLVLGHHAHVLQGRESYRQAGIIYSLGNFIASEVLYADGDVLGWNRKERTGCILLAELDAQRLISVKQIPTYDNGRSIAIDRSGWGEKHIVRLNRALERGITLKQYQRERFRVNKVMPSLRYFRWSWLKTLNWRKFLNKLGRLTGRGKKPPNKSAS